MPLLQMDEMKNSRLLSFHISATVGRAFYGTDTHIFIRSYIRSIKYCADKPENSQRHNYEYSLKAEDKLNFILKYIFSPRYEGKKLNTVSK
jgi:hypothetical protein